MREGRQTEEFTYRYLSQKTLSTTSTSARSISSAASLTNINGPYKRVFLDDICTLTQSLERRYDGSVDPYGAVLPAA